MITLIAGKLPNNPYMFFFRIDVIYLESVKTKFFYVTYSFLTDELLTIIIPYNI